MSYRYLFVLFLLSCNRGPNIKTPHTVPQIAPPELGYPAPAQAHFRLFINYEEGNLLQSSGNYLIGNNRLRDKDTLRLVPDKGSGGVSGWPIVNPG